MVMLLAKIMTLKTRQVNYTQAFPQADLTDPVFMHLPQRWYVDSTGSLIQHENLKFYDTTHYLRLNKNLYSCKQAPWNRYKHLTNGLLAQNFK